MGNSFQFSVFRSGAIPGECQNSCSIIYVDVGVEKCESVEISCYVRTVFGMFQNQGNSCLCHSERSEESLKKTSSSLRFFSSFTAFRTQNDIDRIVYKVLP